MEAVKLGLSTFKVFKPISSYIDGHYLNLITGALNL